MRPEQNATQKLELENGLPQNGWSVVAKNFSSLDWWADEQWIVESNWSPVGFQLFLTFLVDPQSEEFRLKGADVWAIAASTEPLSGPRCYQAIVTIKGCWPEQRESLMMSLNRLREGYKSN